MDNDLNLQYLAGDCDDFMKHFYSINSETPLGFCRLNEQLHPHNCMECRYAGSEKCCFCNNRGRSKYREIYHE